MNRPIKILIAKPGLDGHDRGARVVANALRDAGMEVVYTGLHQTPEMVVEAAVQEDIDVVSVSILSGAHIPLCRKVVEQLEEQGVGDKLLIVGGNIPAQDRAALESLGVTRVFPVGTPFEQITGFLRESVCQ